MKEWSVSLGKAFLYFLIWGGFVAIITNMDKDTISDLPVWANMIIVLFVFLAPIWLSKVLWQKGEEITANVSSQIKEKIEIKQTAQATQQSLNEYADAKNRFKYLSNEALLTKYKQFQEERKDDMIRLALEEELVERKLISHSPMHEKLEALMTKMKM